jgi:hypothetical protein
MESFLVHAAFYVTLLFCLAVSISVAGVLLQYINAQTTLRFFRERVVPFSLLVIVRGGQLVRATGNSYRTSLLPYLSRRIDEFRFLFFLLRRKKVKTVGMLTIGRASNDARRVLKVIAQLTGEHLQDLRENHLPVVVSFIQRTINFFYYISSFIITGLNRFGEKYLPRSIAFVRRVSANIWIKVHSKATIEYIPYLKVKKEKLGILTGQYAEIFSRNAREIIRQNILLYRKTEKGIRVQTGIFITNTQTHYIPRIKKSARQMRDSIKPIIPKIVRLKPKFYQTYTIATNLIIIAVKKLIG